MKAAAFDFDRADTLAEALVSETGDKPVAGNQSLGPMMNLRLVRARRLIDIATVPELRAIVETPEYVRFGAATTHAEVEDGETPDPTSGWMQAAASNIAHRAVRNRGTMGGSLAHADPRGGLGDCPHRVGGDRCRRPSRWRAPHSDGGFYDRAVYHRSWRQ